MMVVFGISSGISVMVDHASVLTGFFLAYIHSCIVFDQLMAQQAQRCTCCARLTQHEILPVAAFCIQHHKVTVLLMRS